MHIRVHYLHLDIVVIEKKGNFADFLTAGLLLVQKFHIVCHFKRENCYF